MLGYVRFEADVTSAGKSRTVDIELDAGRGDALHHVGKQVQNVFLGSLDHESIIGMTVVGASRNDVPCSFGF